MKSLTLIVYVQLGKNPSPTLYFYGGMNAKLLSHSESVLITDYPEYYSDFPGTVLAYKESNFFPGFLKYLKYNKAYSNIAGGYWRFTIERLFALKTLGDHYPLNTPVIHLESDVMLMLDQSILEEMKKLFYITSIPRYSFEAGIASILFSPSIGQMINDLIKLDLLLETNLDITSDMTLLGIGLSRCVLDELPSHPQNALSVRENKTRSGRRIVFDGAAYGQYLFGQDPIHSCNKNISGFINPNFPLNLSEVKWSLLNDLDHYRPSFFWNFEEIQLANIHMHSKLNVEPNNFGVWQQTIDEANGETTRIIGPFVPDLIHTIKSSPLDRIRILRRRGLILGIYRALKRKMKFFS